MQSEDTFLLRKIYQSSKTSMDALVAVSKKSRSYEFDFFLNRQHDKYFDIASDANMLLKQYHQLPEEADAWSKIGFLMALKLETMLNSNPGHIAEILIEGCVGGVNEMLSEINSLKEVNAESLDLAHILIETEQETISVLQRYL